MTTGFSFNWHDLRLEARCSGALWMPALRWLVVSDLHLGKSERMARRGGALLPPYESAETLGRLSDEVDALNPDVVISLGDSFDDDAAAHGLDPAEVDTLAGLARGRTWVWVAGNHDPAAGSVPGVAVAAKMAGTVTLRHEAKDEGPDISGHYHPALRLAGARRKAFLVGPTHLIMPAFGRYTGGLDADTPALAQWVKGGFGVVCVHRALPVPLTAAARPKRMRLTNR